MNISNCCTPTADFVPVFLTGEFTPDSQGAPMNFSLETREDPVVEQDEEVHIELSSSDSSVAILNGAEITTVIITNNDSKHS